MDHVRGLLVSRRWRFPKKALLMLALLATAIALFASPPTASATTLAPLTVEQLSQMADSVVVATPEGTHAYQVGPASSSGLSSPGIETLVSLKVVEVLKGSSIQSKTIVVPGGTIGDLSLKVEGFPTFSTGETCILFLDSQGRVIGGTQGKIVLSGAEASQLGQSASDLKQRIRSASGGAQEVAESVAGLSVNPGSKVRSAATNLKIQPAQTSRSRSLNSIGAASTGVLFSDGFESYPGPWLVNGSPTWAYTGYRAATGSRCMYCAGSWANAPGPYYNNMDARLFTGPFDLSQAGTGTLQFDMYLNTEPNYDKCSYLISTDGTNFYGSGWTGYSAGWGHASIDLTRVEDGFGGYRNVCGQSRVWIMFRFTSDSTNVWEGAYIDNVTLSVVGRQAAPTISSISPASGSAGTGSSVTISGSGFGASQGSGYVSFYCNESYFIKPAVTSWSNSRIVCSVPVALINGQTTSAGSGPVEVVNSSGEASNDQAFNVTFGYGGVRWASAGCNFEINASGTGVPNAVTMVRSAASTWNAASAFQFSYAGSSSGSSVARDGHNLILWSSSLVPSGVIAVTMTWWQGSTIVEDDLCFNSNYRWGDGSGGTMDVQTVALHEMGHWLQLLDLYGSDSDKVMYGMGDYGEIHRTLQSGDIAGARWIYGNPGPTTTTTLPPTTTTTLPPTTTTTLPPTTTTTLSSTTTTISLPSTTTTTNPSAPEFGDVPSSHPYYAQIADLASRGVITGFANGTFQPDASVTRQQFAKMIVKTLNLPVSDSDACPFIDVPSNLASNDPLYPDHYVAVCAAHGITVGKTATSFAPFASITRAQLITMVSRAVTLTDPPTDYVPPFAPFDTTHYPYSRRAAYAGVLNGLQGIGPDYGFFDPATRGEVCVLLYNLLHR
jgi:hypothetical protein